MEITKARLDSGEKANPNVTEGSRGESQEVRLVEELRTRQTMRKTECHNMESALSRMEYH